LLLTMLQQRSTRIGNNIASTESSSLRRQHVSSTQWKGRKSARFPLWPHTSKVLQAWFLELEGKCGMIAFTNARGKPYNTGWSRLSDQGSGKGPPPARSRLADKRVSPHLIRHSTAMHLLQSGVDISVIALWLGHESIETTHIYLKQTSKRRNGLWLGWCRPKGRSEIQAPRLTARIS